MPRKKTQPARFKQKMTSHKNDIPRKLSAQSDHGGLENITGQVVEPGTVFGPFAVALASQPDSGRTIELLDCEGDSRFLAVDDVHALNWLQRISRGADHKSIPNSQLLLNEDGLFVKMTHAATFDDILASRTIAQQLETDTSAAISVSEDEADSENLVRVKEEVPDEMESNYAEPPAKSARKDAQQERSSIIYSSPESRGPSLTSTAYSIPRIVMVPCGLLPPSDSSIQIIGPPQVVIPIAICPNTASLDPNLLLDPALCQSLVSVHGTVNLGVAIGRNNYPPYPPSAPTQSQGISAVSRSLDNQSNSPVAESARNGQPISNEIPLDLTKKKSDSPHSWPVTKSKKDQSGASVGGANSLVCSSISPEIDVSTLSKGFSCAQCGIRFSTQKTLYGHQRFYCKAAAKSPNNGAKDSQLQAAIQSQEFCCHLCDFTAATTAQLAQHAKLIHALIQSYLCSLCGYKGYSVRGMKSHFKTAHVEHASAGRNLDQLTLANVVQKGGLAEKLNCGGDSGSKAASEENSMGTPHGSPDLTANPLNASGSGYSCSNCKQSYKGMESYIKHVCEKPPRDAASLYEVNFGFKVLTDQEGTPKFSCNVCSYASAHKGNVKRHITLVHGIGNIVNAKK